MTTKNYTTNRIKKVWIAEFCDYEEYGRMGIFDSPLKALIACFKDYKEYKKQFPDFNRTPRSKHKFLRTELIKRLKCYEINRAIIA